MIAMRLQNHYVCIFLCGVNWQNFLCRFTCLIANIPVQFLTFSATIIDSIYVSKCPILKWLMRMIQYALRWSESTQLALRCYIFSHNKNSANLVHGNSEFCSMLIRSTQNECFWWWMTKNDNDTICFCRNWLNNHN